MLELDLSDAEAARMGTLLVLGLEAATKAHAERVGGHVMQVLEDAAALRDGELVVKVLSALP